MNIWFLGDSTAAIKTKGERPETGWVEKLAPFLEYKIQLYNLAKNGESTRSFLASDRFIKFKSDIQAGDVVFIQFGHNDQKVNESAKFAAPWSTYQKNLLLLIELTQKNGGYPVLITSTVRRSYNSRNQIANTFGDYLTVVRQLSVVKSIPLIDINESMRLKFNEMKREDTKKLYMNLPKKQFDNYPDGRKDNTHFSELGAEFVAKLFVAEIRENSYELRKILKDEFK